MRTDSRREGPARDSHGLKPEVRQLGHQSPREVNSGIPIATTRTPIAHNCKSSLAKDRRGFCASSSG